MSEFTDKLMNRARELDSRPGLSSSSAPSGSSGGSGSFSERLLSRARELDRKVTPSYTWQGHERAERDFDAWAPQIEEMDTSLANREKILNGYVERLQALQEEPYSQSNAYKYRAMYDNYEMALREYNDMVRERNALSGRMGSALEQYRSWSGGQDAQAETYRQEAAALDERNAELDREMRNYALVNTPFGLENAGPYQAMQEEYDANAARAAELRRMADEAQWQYYGGLRLNEDWDEHQNVLTVAEMADRGYITESPYYDGSIVYEYINDINNRRDMMHGYDASGTRYEAYSKMTPDEIAVYNYIYSAQGPEAAETYLSRLRNELNTRLGTENYEEMGGLGKALYWIPAGFDRFAQGLRQLGKEEAVPVTPMTVTSSLIQQEAQERSPVLGGLYDLGANITNMVPSLLASVLTGGAFGAAAGSALLGASAGGNTYADVMRDPERQYSAQQARDYATLVGVSEGALSYLLGGISRLGGVSTRQVLTKLGGLDNALGRIARSSAAPYVMSMISEGTEEGLQELLEPAFATLILGTEYDANFGDAAYAFLLGALTAGIVEGAEIGVSRALGGGQGFTYSDMDGFVGENGVNYFEGCDTLEEVEARYRELARENHLGLGGDTSVMADINRQHDMAKAFFQGRRQGAERRRERRGEAEGETTRGVAGALTAAQEAAQTATEVEALLSSGNVSNSVAERIINTPELRAQFEALTGQQLTGTKSEMRNTIKEFARQRAADAAVERFEADVAEMNGEGVTQTPLQNVNTPVMPDSSVVSPTDSLGAAPRGYSVGHAPEIVENQRHAVENVVSPENLNPAQTHERLSNRDREYYAQQRLGVDLEGEMAELPVKQNWDATDAQTAFDILRMVERRANESRSEADIAELAKWQALIDRKGSGVGQTLQVYAAQARQSGDPAVVVADAANILAAEEARTNAPQDAKAAASVARGVGRAVRNARKDISAAFNEAGEGKRPSKHGGIVQQVEGQMSLDLGRAEVTRSSEQIQRDIRSALKDIGTTINQVARGDRNNDANLQTQISTILQQKYGFTPGEATNVGEIVGNYFNQMVVDESNRILANIFKTREPSVQRTFEERLNEMMNLGAFSNDNYAQLASDALFGGALNLQNPEHRRVLTEVYDYARRLADIPEGDTASTIQLINELSSRRRTDSLIGNGLLDGMKNWALNQIAQREGGAQFLHDLALSQIRQITNDYRHRSASDYIFGVRYLNLLSGIPTVLRNLVGNPAFSLVETNSNNVGVLIDSLLSKKTGQRTMALDRSMFSSAARQGALDAFLRSYLEVAFDADVSNAQNRYGQGGGRTFRMSGNPLERFFSTWEKWNRYMLTTTDETAKGAARGETTRGLRELQDRGADVGDEFIADRANQVALERTFQNDSNAARASRHIQSGLDAISRGVLGRTAIPFAKIGANVGTQYANYSPAGMVNATWQLIKTLRDTHRGTITPEQQAQTAMAFGRTLTGGSLIAMFTALALKGILTVASGDDEKELDRTEGLTGTHLNLSAAVRWLKGESTEYQDGDELLNIGFLEPINGLMSMGSMIADDIEEDPNATFWQRLGDIGQASAAGLFQALSELPAMSGLQDIQDAFTYADGEEVGDKLANATLDYLGSQLSGFVVPNFVTNIAEGLDPYVRAPWQADSRAEELMYQFMADIPGLRQNVPVRQDIWGQDMTYTDSDAMNFANQTVLPGTITNYRTNWANQEIRRLGELPPKMPTSFTIDNEAIEMNQDQQREYARAWGDAALQSILALEGNLTYESLSDADQKAVIDSIYDYASGIAKKAIDDRYELSGTIEKAQEYGNPGEYFMFNEALKNIEDSKGADTAAFNAVMEDYANMDASEQNALMEMLGENTRFDDVVEAYEAGISPEEWYDAYDKYKELDANGNLSANDAATEFAKWLDTDTDFTNREQDVLEEQFIFWTMISGDTERYDMLINHGFTPEQALNLYDEIGTMNTYTSDGVSGGKKAKVVAHINRLNISQADKDWLYLDVMGYSKSGLDETPWHQR